MFLFSLGQQYMKNRCRGSYSLYRRGHQLTQMLIFFFYVCFDAVSLNNRRV